MKTATYTLTNGKKDTVSYDEHAPCRVCGEPVGNASMGGTDVCPACDCGKCRHCGMNIMVLRESVDGGQSKRKLLEHMAWHKHQKAA